MSATGLALPHDADTEREILAAAIVNPDKCAHLAGMLEGEDFYKATHRMIWEAVSKSFANHGTVDEALLTHYLRAANTLESVGFKGLSEVLNRAGLTSNVDAYAKLIRQHRGRRELIKAADRLTSMALDTDGDALELTINAERAVRDATDLFMPDTSDLEESGIDEHYRRCMAGHDASGGITSGIGALDYRMTLQPGWLGVILAKPAMGKTALAMAYALQALKAGRPVLFLSLEMPKADLSGRLLTQMCGVPFDLQRYGLDRLSGRDLERFMVSLDEFKRNYEGLLKIVYDPQMTPEALRLNCQRVKQEHGDLGLIVLDYLQRCTGFSRRKNASEESEIAAASGAMKSAAMEFDAAALALSQPTIAASRGGSAPIKLSDAKGSQAIVADADVALLPNRPNMQPDIKGNSDAAKAQRKIERQRATISVPKFRHGPPFDVREGEVRWNGARMTYETPPGWSEPRDRREWQ